MDELSRITEKIVELIGASDSATLAGVRLGAALKKAFPSFAPAAYQCRNLRLFINKHVPQVIEKAYTGVDVVYTLAARSFEPAVEPGKTPQTPSDIAPTISLPTDPITWKAYSNPSYPFTVIANRETGELRAVGEKDVPQDPWLIIPKISPATHFQIASEFVSGLSDAPKAALTSVLAEPQWYVSFFGTTKRFGLSQQWGLFKREHMIRHFTAALNRHGIPAASAAPKHDISHPRTLSAKGTADTRYGASDTQLRDLVSRLAHTLPIEELRSIRIPIGLVLDAFRQ